MKAHSKICGTRERDTFITHRAFCDALARESSKSRAEAEPPLDDEHPKSEIALVPAVPTVQEPPAIPTSTTVASPVSPVRNREESPALANSVASCSSSIGSCSNGSSSNDVPELAPCSSSEPVSLCLTMNQEGSSIFVSSGQEHRDPPTPQPALSATALLQKAALIGASSSNASLLRGLGVLSGPQIEPDGASLAAGLAFGLACNGGSGLEELMLGTPSVFGPKHITLDLLGLGMAANGGPIGANGFDVLHQ
ncbi:zinc finger protein NUTCRACKER [Dorcoceras hygrometricum]|uniref:Zinc finger protein NUTCRACKER n=1 Tax=Dorcoceras hygrometricum TaxID=472368 RepID=A0A2Z7ABF7_9LAMI|nr:zinc finger protein NUTCRACKER [Dorcoceras hygrometricum]